MRARHRHFNPKDAGASFALDARYGFNQADNSDVNTWHDRTIYNANATQTTNAYKPKYRTAIQGGQPAVEFIPTPQNQKMLNGSVSITNNVLTAFHVARMNSSAPSFARVLALSKNNANDYNSSTRCIPLLRNLTNNQFYSFRSGSPTGTINISTNTWYHYTNTFDGSTNQARLNETTTQSVSSTGNFDIEQFRIGFAYDNTVLPGSTDTIGAWDGYIAHISLFNSALSDSLRKRVQFCNAYSFKIACS